MVELDHYREILYKILSQYTLLMGKPHLITSTLVVSEKHDHFIVINEGWDDNKRIHSLVYHAEIREDKVWVHHDGIDQGITEELVVAGIPKEHIVLAFHPPHIRQHTGYAMA